MKFANTIGKIVTDTFFEPPKTLCAKCGKEYEARLGILFHGKDYCSYDCFMSRNDKFTGGST